MNMIGFVLNGVLLVLLGATIFFAVRLSLLLGSFRSSRGELASLISDLSRTIDQAQIAIAGLRESAREGGRELQDKINEARKLGDELDVMTASGEKLARRLEAAMTRAREEGALVAGGGAGGSAGSGTAALFRGTPRKGAGGGAEGASVAAASGGGGFSIRDREMNDREMERGDVRGGAESKAESRAGAGMIPDRPALFPGDDPAEADEEAMPDGLYSKAERDLYSALKKGTGRGRGA